MSSTTGSVSERLRDVDLIVGTPSVDGILTMASVVRTVGHPVALRLTRPKLIYKVNPRSFGPRRRKVALVNLAVNSACPEMTMDFVHSLDREGHELVAIVDEHDAEDWRTVLRETNLSPDRLAVHPQSRAEGRFGSSGAVLLSALGESVDPYTRELLESADRADRVDYSTHFGNIVNRSIKPNPRDQWRKRHLISHLAFDRAPDEHIEHWMREYDLITENHHAILETKAPLGPQICRIVAGSRLVDWNSLKERLFREGNRVIVAAGMFLDISRHEFVERSAFFSRPGTLNLYEILRRAGIAAFGSPSKVFVHPSFEPSAVEAIRKVLESNG